MQFDFKNKPLVAKAHRMAIQHHSGIVRRYTGEPYIRHPERVVERLLGWGFNQDDTLAAAFLHDCCEDKCRNGLRMPVTEIKADLNGRVAAKVQALTRYPNMSEEDYTQNLSIQPHDVRVIKLADILDNITGLAVLDPKYAEKYLVKKAKQVTAIGNTTARPFREQVSAQLTREFMILSENFDRRVLLDRLSFERQAEEYRMALASIEQDFANIAMF